MTEGELKKRIEVWGELHKKIFRLSNNVLLKSKSEAVTEILKMPNAHSPFEDVLQILEVLDEAKQEFPKEDDFMACEGDDDNWVLLIGDFSNAIDNWLKKWFGE